MKSRGPLSAYIDCSGTLLPMTTNPDFPPQHSPAIERLHLPSYWALFSLSFSEEFLSQ